MADQQRILVEELSLGEGRSYAGASAGVPYGPGVTTVLRVAALKAAGVKEEAAPADLELALSPSGQTVAVVELRRRRVALLSASDRFSHVTSTFEPLPLSLDGDEAADCIATVSWGVGADGEELLLALCRSSCLYLLRSNGGVLRQWEPEEAPWRGQALVAAAFGPAGTLFLLSARRAVLWLQPGAAAGGSDALITTSIKRYHGVARSLLFNERTGTLLVGGDGGDATAAAAAAAAGPQQGDPSAGVTLSLWQLDGGRTLKLKSSWGRPRGAGLIAWAAGAALGAGSAPPRPWRCSIDPLGEHAALVTHTGSCVVASLADSKPVDVRTAFAGQSAAAAGPTPGSPLGPRIIPLAASIAAASWWGPRALAVATAAGEVAVVRLPGATNVLGDAPLAFAPGAAVCVRPRAPAGGGVWEPGAALVVVAPIVPGWRRPRGGAHGNEDSSSERGSGGGGGSPQLSAAGQMTTTAAPVGRVATWLAARLGVGDEITELAVAAGGAEPSATSSVDSDAAGASAFTTAAATTAVMGPAAPVGWRLSLLAERTPAQMVGVHLRDRDWGAALRLCRAAGVHPDVVYRARWAAAPVTKENIADNLTRITDRKWVVSECLTRLAPDYESQRLLINYGLRETDRHAGPKAAADAAAAAAAATPPQPPPPQWTPAAIGRDGPEARWWRWRRLELWRASDRLDTARAMARGGAHDPAAFEALRTAPLPAAAAALAATGNVAALSALLQRHPAALGPHLLAILSALPETLDPRTYSGLLPRTDTGAPPGVTLPGPPTALPPPPPGPPGPGRPLPPPTGSGGRRTDWAELPEAWRELAAVANGGAGALDGNGAVAPAGQQQLQRMASVDSALREEAVALLHATEDIERAGLAAAAASAAAAAGVPPPPGGGSLWPAPGAGIAAWYAQRAIEIDAFAGQLGNGLALIELALQRGAPPTAPLPPAAGAAAGLTLSQLQASGRVLAAAVRAWFPAAPSSAPAESAASGGTAGVGSTAGPSLRAASSQWLRSRLGGRGARSLSGGGAVGAEAAAAAASAGGARVPAEAGPPVWLVGLGEFAAMPLAQQLEVALAGRDVNLLDSEVNERILPLLALRPPSERIPALRALLASAARTHPVWAVALVERESRLLSMDPSAAARRRSARSSAAGGWADGWEDAGSDGGSGGDESPGDDEAFEDAREEAGPSFDGGSSSSDSDPTAPVNAPPGAVWGDACALAEAVMAAVLGEGGEEGGESAAVALGAVTADVERLLDAAGDALEGQLLWQKPAPDAARRARTARLASDLGGLRGAGRAAKLLAKHAAPVGLAEMRAAGPGEARSMVQELLANAERRGGAWRDSEWAQLWKDLREARQWGLPGLPETELGALFLRTLLLAGRHRLAAAFLPRAHETVAAAVAAAAAQAAAEGRDAGAAAAAAAAAALRAAGVDQGSDEAVALLAAAADAVAAAGAAAEAGEGDEGPSAGGAERSPRVSSSGAGSFWGDQQSGKQPPRSPRQALLSAFSRQRRVIGGARQVASAASAALQRAAGVAVGGAAAAQLADAVQTFGAATKLGAEAAASLVGRSAGRAAALAGTAATLAAGAATTAASTAANIAMLAATTAGGEGGAAALLLGSLGAGPDMPGARGLLSEAEAEAVVISVAREALYSAASLEDPAVDQAAACLELLPSSQAARRELDAIAALRRLPEFGVSLLPAQLRDLPDRRELLNAIMAGRGFVGGQEGHAEVVAAAGEGAGKHGVAPWRRLSDVLEVAALLGLDGRETEMEVRLLAGEMALAAGEVGVAEHMALALACARHEPAWRLAAAIAAPATHARYSQQAASSEAEQGNGGEPGLTAAAAAADGKAAPLVGDASRLALLAFAVCHCPREELGPLTDELLECQALVDRSNAAHGQSLTTSDAGPEGREVVAAALAGAPTRREQQLLSAGAAATAGGRTALDGLPTLGDPHLLLAGLLAGGDPTQAETRLAAALEAAVAAAADESAYGPAAFASKRERQQLEQMQQQGPSYILLQRVLTIGAAAQLLLAAAPSAATLAPSAVGAAAPQGPAGPAAARRRLLLLRVCQLADAVGKLQETGSIGESGGAAAAAAERCWQRLRQASDSRRLRDVIPSVESSRFIAGDADYQRHVCAELARQAGERAAAALALPDAAASAGAQSEAEAQLSEALALAGTYRVDEWPLRFSYLNALILGAPGGGNGGAVARQAAGRHAPALLTQPAEFAAALYRETWPHIQPAATGTVVLVLSLLADALRAAAAAPLAAAAQPEGAEAGAAAEGSDQQQQQVDAAAAAASLPPLVRLRDLFEKSSRVLAGLASKPLAAAHVAMLVEPCLPAPVAATPPAGGDGDDAQQQPPPQLPPQPAPSAAGGAPPPGFDVAAFSVAGAAAVAEHVARTGAAGAGHVSKLLKHLAGIAEMLEAPAPARHLALRRALSQLGGPGLPFLALCCGALAVRSNGTGAAAGEPEPGTAAAAAEAAAAEDGREAVTTHLSKLAPQQLAALGGFVAGTGAQPMPAAAVGPLRPLVMGDATRALLLADIAALLLAPDAQPLPSAAAAAAAAGGPTAGPDAAAATWLPAPLPPGLNPRRRAAAAPLLGVARRLAARRAALAAAEGAGLPERESAATAEDIAAWVVAAPEQPAEGDASAPPPPSPLQRLVARLASVNAGGASLLDLSNYICALRDWGQQPESGGSVVGSTSFGARTLSSVGSASSSRLQVGAVAESEADSTAGDESGAADAAAAPATAAEDEECAAQLDLPTAQSEVAAALCGAASAALNAVREQLVSKGGGSGGDDEHTVAEVMLQLEVLVGCLDAPPPSPSRQRPAAAAGDGTDPLDVRLGPLRTALWGTLSEFIAAVPTAAYGHPAVAALLELRESAAGSGRWRAWRPPAAAGGAAAAAAAAGAGALAAGGPDGGAAAAAEDVTAAAGGAGLLFARTMGVFARHWPQGSGVEAPAPEDVSSLEAVSALFLRLLGAAATRQQLLALQGLLRDVWREGDTLAAPAAAPEATAAQTADGQAPEGSGAAEAWVDGLPPVSPLHGCWAALLEAAVARGKADLALAVFDEVATAVDQGQGQRGQHGHPRHPLRLPLEEAEVYALSAAAKAEPSAGLPAALCLGLLSPYAAHQRAAAERLRRASLPGSSPYAAHLLCAVVYRGAFAGLAATGPAPLQPRQQQEAETRQVAFSQLCALLMAAPPHPAVAPQQAPLPRSQQEQQEQLGKQPSAQAALASEAAAALLPHAVAQLVAAGQIAAAAQLAATRLQLHPSLAFFGGALFVLERFVAAAAHLQQGGVGRVGSGWGAGGGGAADAALPPALLPCCCAALQSGAADAARRAYERLAAAARGV